MASRSTEWNRGAVSSADLSSNTVSGGGSATGAEAKKSPMFEVILEFENGDLHSSYDTVEACDVHVSDSIKSLMITEMLEKPVIHVWGRLMTVEEFRAHIISNKESLTAGTPITFAIKKEHSKVSGDGFSGVIQLDLGNHKKILSDYREYYSKWLAEGLLQQGCYLCGNPECGGECDESPRCGRRDGYKCYCYDDDDDD